MGKSVQVLVGLGVACLVAAGCSGTREMAPTAPSAIQSGWLQSEAAGSSSGFTSAAKADEGENHKVELRGTVADLTGTCPAMTFHVGRVIVTTNVKTKFEGIPCAGLKNGNFVKVTGDPDPKVEKAVLATKVEAATHDSRPVEVTGKISDVTDTKKCPTVSFTVGTTKVTANGRTHYRGLTCADLATWKDEVVVKGQRQADGSLLATQVVAAKKKD